MALSTSPDFATFLCGTFVGGLFGLSLGLWIATWIMGGFPKRAGKANQSPKPVEEHDVFVPTLEKRADYLREKGVLSVYREKQGR